MNAFSGTRRVELTAKTAIAAVLVGGMVSAVAAAPPPVTAERTSDGGLRIRSTGTAAASRTAAPKPRTPQTRDGQDRTAAPARTPEEMRRRLLEQRKQLEARTPRPTAAQPAARATPAPPASGLEGPVDPPFRVFSWQEPRGAALGMDTVQTFVRVKVDGAGSPEESAERIVNEILDRNLQHEEVAILLQHFGMGDGGTKDTGYPLPPAPALFWHWCDGLRHAEPHGTPEQQACEVLGPTDATQEWWRTPWMSHGIAESRQWMDRFIARYKQRQAEDPRIPDPSRFHFDSENNTTPRRVWATREFHAMKSDPRWETEPIPGFEGRPMSKLYEDAGAPQVDPTRKAFQIPNRQWRDWYEGVCIQAADAAMDAAAYQPIREAWPSAASSNWRTSDAYDGVDGRFRIAVNGTVTSVNRAFGDIQAPVLYGKSPLFHMDPDAREQVMRGMRGQVENLMFSFGCPHTNIAPWTYVPGQRVARDGEQFRIQEDQLRRFVGMLRDRGINEMLLWSNGDTQVGTRWWDDTADAIRDATAFSLRGAVVSHGAADASGDAADRLRLRHRDELAILSRPHDPAHRVEIRTRFRHRDGLFAAGDGVLATVYARSDQPGVTARLAVRDWRTDREIPLGTIALDSIHAEHPADHRFELSGASDVAMLDRYGMLELVVRFEAPQPFIVRVDSVSMMRTDHAPADTK